VVRKRKEVDGEEGWEAGGRGNGQKGTGVERLMAEGPGGLSGKAGRGGGRQRERNRQLLVAGVSAAAGSHFPDCEPWG